MAGSSELASADEAADGRVQDGGGPHVRQKGNSCFAQERFQRSGWAKLPELLQQTQDNSAQWHRVDLFRDIEAALEEDPAGENAHALVARSREQLEANSGGDPEIKAGLLAGWARRREWPESYRWMVEGLSMMRFERFERAADFLDQARGGRRARKERQTNRP